MRSFTASSPARAVARAAAALVLGATLAACGGGDAAEPGSTDGSTFVAVGNDALKWEDTTLSAPAGTVVVGLEAAGSVNHDFVITGVNGDAAIVEVAGKSSGTGTVELEAGTYEFYCSIVGHREAGMVGELVVS